MPAPWRCRVPPGATAGSRRWVENWPDRPVSAIPEKARGIPITRGAAEDVLRYDPDLVLAGPYGVSATVDLLRRLGRNVVAVPTQPQDLDGVRVFVRALAAAVGEPAK